MAYDATNRESFRNLNQWIQARERFYPSNTPIILVATKSDLTNKCEIPFAEAKEFAKKHSLLGPIATSSKKGTNIETCFETLAEKAIEMQFHGHNKTNSHRQDKKSSHNVGQLNLDQALDAINRYKANRDLISRELYYGIISTFFGGFTKTVKFAAADTLKEVLNGTKTIDFLVPYQGAYGQGELKKLYKSIEHLLPKAEAPSELQQGTSSRVPSN